MLTHFKEDKLERLIVGCNKKPRWDEAAGGHTLNFRGRVTEKSVKNFQIKCEGVAGDETVLQFGRVGKNRFTMDFGHPFSPLQAFAICLASLDGKAADSGALNGVKKGLRGAKKGLKGLGKKFRKGKAGPASGEGDVGVGSKEGDAEAGRGAGVKYAEGGDDSDSEGEGHGDAVGVGGGGAADEDARPTRPSAASEGESKRDSGARRGGADDGGGGGGGGDDDDDDDDGVTAPPRPARGNRK
jgi:hypothetical protein